MKKPGVSERRGCELADISRSGYRYRARSRHDAPLAEALRDYSRQHPREGYRQALCAAAKRLGEPLNHQRVARVWCQEDG